MKISIEMFGVVDIFLSTIFETSMPYFQLGNQSYSKPIVHVQVKWPLIPKRF